MDKRLVNNGCGYGMVYGLRWCGCGVIYGFRCGFVGCIIVWFGLSFIGHIGDKPGITVHAVNNSHNPAIG